MTSTIVTRGFCDELRKIAFLDAPNVGIGVGGGLLMAAGRVGNRLLNTYTVPRVFKEELANKNVVELRKRSIKHSPVPIYTYKNKRDNGVGFYSDGRFDTSELKEYGLDRVPEKRFIALDADIDGPPSILAHEVGHAQIDQNGLGRLMQGYVRPYADAVTRLAPVGSFASAISDIHPTAGAIGSVAVPVLGKIPELWTEYDASRRGLKYLKNEGATPEQLAAAKQTLRAAFGTYASRAMEEIGRVMLAEGAGRQVAHTARKLEGTD